MVPEYEHLKEMKLKSIFITGATGYLGAYILERLADLQNARIYCLVRGRSDKECRQRLRQVLTYYFGIETCAYIFGRVSVIMGDISVVGLGIEPDIYAKLKKIDTVIHCAALTDHIGHSDDFQRINIDGTHHVVGFAQKMKASLLHISTISVSGTHYTHAPENKGKFSESCYFIGQNYEDNEYTKSKFLAEGIVLDAVSKGLNARIMRVGNLTCSIDGVFQLRPEKNAFANRIKAICALGCLPVNMISARIEMTPVDICVQAILDLAKLADSKQLIYHVFNTNSLTLGEIVTMLKENGYRIRVLSEEKFLCELSNASKHAANSMLARVTEDTLDYGKRDTINISSDATMQLLLHEGFSWPVIDNEYIRSFLGCINSRRTMEI